jgi:hypothetical protein
LNNSTIPESMKGENLIMKKKDKEVKNEDQKQDSIEKREFVRALKVAFTSEEKVSIADQVTNTIRKHATKKAELASIKKRYTAEIEALELSVESLSESYNSGWAMKEVDCVEVRDYRTGTISIWKKDSLEKDPPDKKEGLLEERPMTGIERQRSLPLKEKETETEEQVESSKEEQEEAGNTE